jgi:DNA/RNA endonuclease YhcR with UshA esterase domain
MDFASLAAGATITVAGRIEDYKGQLEIVPKNAGAITVTAPAPLP